MMLRAMIFFLTAVPLTSLAQVHSLTLGFDVNSPYGLSEPWFTLRNALLRCEDLHSVAERAEVKTGTAEATTKGGQLPDLEKLERIVSESGAGATLRGVEATIEGELVMRDGTWLLRVFDKDVPLQPISELIQHERKKPRQPTAQEAGAYTRLLQNARTQKRWRVIGPLRHKPELTLEVRTFERAKTNN